MKNHCKSQTISLILAGLFLAAPILADTDGSSYQQTSLEVAFVQTEAMPAADGDESGSCKEICMLPTY